MQSGRVGLTTNVFQRSVFWNVVPEKLFCPVNKDGGTLRKGAALKTAAKLKQTNINKKHHSKHAYLDTVHIDRGKLDEKLYRNESIIVSCDLPEGLSS